MPGLKRDVENDILWSEIGSTGFGEPGGTTKNSQEYPLWVLFTVRDITLPLKWIKIFISKGKDFQLVCYLLGPHL